VLLNVRNHGFLNHQMVAFAESLIEEGRARGRGGRFTLFMARRMAVSMRFEKTYAGSRSTTLI
jgi:hypothetical protein